MAKKQSGSLWRRELKGWGRAFRQVGGELGEACRDCAIELAGGKPLKRRYTYDRRGQKRH